MIWLVLLAILAASQADRALAQEVPESFQRFKRFQLFNDCKPFRLIVESLHSDATEIGLTEASIQAAVESRLRSARLYDSGTGGPFLYVSVNVAPGGAYSRSLEYNKLVYDPASDVTGMATTWDSASTGAHGGDSGHILSVISASMDHFIVEYLRVNESACK